MTQSIVSLAIKIVCEQEMLVLAKALSRLVDWDFEKFFGVNKQRALKACGVVCPKEPISIVSYEAVYPFASRSFNKDTYTCFDCFLARALSKPSGVLLHTVSSKSLMLFLLQRTMSGRYEVEIMFTGMVERGDSDARRPGRSA